LASALSADKNNRVCQVALRPYSDIQATGALPSHTLCLFCAPHGLTLATVTSLSLSLCSAYPCQWRLRFSLGTRIRPVRRTTSISHDAFILQVATDLRAGAAQSRHCYLIFSHCLPKLTHVLACVHCSVAVCFVLSVVAEMNTLPISPGQGGE
jgi:hypothetical protein